VAPLVFLLAVQDARQVEPQLWVGENVDEAGGDLGDGDDGRRHVVGRVADRRRERADPLRVQKELDRWVPLPRDRGVQRHPATPGRTADRSVPPAAVCCSADSHERDTLRT
jgi:hypothetical protein